MTRLAIFKQVAMEKGESERVFKQKIAAMVSEFPAMQAFFDTEIAPADEAAAFAACRKGFEEAKIMPKGIGVQMCERHFGPARSRYN